MSAKHRTVVQFDYKPPISEVSIMGNGIGIYKNPWCNQYVCPEGYAFFYNGINQGRIIWTASPEGYYVDKDEIK